MSRIIALLTDFGTADSYVGVMKGVMKSINPTVEFLDLTHAIMPQNIRQGALTLLAAYRYLPPGTVFLAVVDPGVGGARRAIAVEAGGYFFVAPDNGVLSYVLRILGVYKAVVLSDAQYHLPEVSFTFHGRDIFSPVAAYLSKGVDIDAFGPPAHDLKMLSVPRLLVDEQAVYGEVLHIDHFGNVITSIGRLDWVDDETVLLRSLWDDGPALSLVAAKLVVELNSQRISGLSSHYSAVLSGQAIALVSSDGWLELALNEGNYAVDNAVTTGDWITLWR